MDYTLAQYRPETFEGLAHKVGVRPGCASCVLCVPLARQRAHARLHACTCAPCVGEACAGACQRRGSACAGGCRWRWSALGAQHQHQHQQRQAEGAPRGSRQRTGALALELVSSPPPPPLPPGPGRPAWPLWPAGTPSIVVGDCQQAGGGLPLPRGESASPPWRGRRGGAPSGPSGPSQSGTARGMHASHTRRARACVNVVAVAGSQ